jgi:ABC-2 type transport system permease protein
MVIRKHLKLYVKLAKFAIQLETEYRGSFALELVVEFGYFFVGLISLNMIYFNVKEIAGWGFFESLVLLGLGMSASEITTGLAYVHNLRALPFKIIRGELDNILTKPINNQFAVSLWRPYFAMIPPTIFGFLIATNGFVRGGFSLTANNLVLGIFTYVCGIICAYSFGMMVTTLSMWLTNAMPLPFVAQNIYYMGQRPLEIFRGFWKTFFTYILPLAFFANFPARILMGSGSVYWAPTAGILAVSFLKISNIFWNHALKHYESAGG